AEARLDVEVVRAAQVGGVGEQRRRFVLAVVHGHRDAHADAAAAAAAVGRQRFRRVRDVACGLERDVAAAADRRLRSLAYGLFGIGEADVARHRAGHAVLAAARAGGRLRAERVALVAAVVGHRRLDGEAAGAYGRSADVSLVRGVRVVDRDGCADAGAAFADALEDVVRSRAGRGKLEQPGRAARFRVVLRVVELDPAVALDVDEVVVIVGETADRSAVVPRQVMHLVAGLQTMRAADIDRVLLARVRVRVQLDRARGRGIELDRAEHRAAVGGGRAGDVRRRLHGEQAARMDGERVGDVGLGGRELDVDRHRAGDADRAVRGIGRGRALALGALRLGVLFLRLAVRVAGLVGGLAVDFLAAAVAVVARAVVLRATGDARRGLRARARDRARREAHRAVGVQVATGGRERVVVH